MSRNDAPHPPAPGGRSPDGRFARGNKAAKGNPHNRRMHALRSMASEAVGTDQIAAVVKKLVEQAKAGDVPSAKLLFEYTLGKPPQAVERSGPEDEPVGVSLDEIRTAILDIVGEDPEARARVARA